jgi:hypothetical protein
MLAWKEASAERELIQNSNGGERLESGVYISGNE